MQKCSALAKAEPTPTQLLRSWLQLLGEVGAQKPLMMDFHAPGRSPLHAAHLVIHSSSSSWAL